MDRYSRIRTVKLRRSRAGENFGFSARGGFEYGTGIFVSSVEPRSAACKAKLRVGDQILRVNGYPVAYALHSEFVTLMRARNSLQLKIRSVGMIPVRETAEDALSWKLVEDNNVVETSNYDVPDSSERLSYHRGSQSPPAHSKGSVESESWSNNYRDSRLAEIFVDTQGHSGLGCCICKGPPERPGIFVQSTKSNGVAKDAGLRPGDQILHCNGLSFIDIAFAEAVFHMKVSKKLNMIVVKGAAADLFPGESSGYNSSASSSIGDHQGMSSRPSSDPNNCTSLEDHEESGSFRLHRFPKAPEARRGIPQGMTHSESDDDESAVLDRHTEWIEVEETWKEAEKRNGNPSQTPHSKKLSSVDMPNGRNGEILEDQRLLEERQKLIEEQRKLIEQALKFEEEKRKFEEEKKRLERKQPADQVAVPTPKNSRSGSEDNSTNKPMTSLAGALHNEILKRVERREASVALDETGDEKPKPGTVDERISIFASGNVERKQHEQLMKEFKKVHKKMFASPSEEGEATVDTKPAPLPSQILKEVRPEEKKVFGILRTRKEVEHERKMVQHQVAGIVKQLQLKIERQQQENHETEREVVHSTVIKQDKSPPPPPPFPTMNEAALGKVVNALANNSVKTAMSPERADRSQEKRVIITMCDAERERGAPKSPSPDYSNSSSPVPPEELIAGLTKPVFRKKGYFEKSARSSADNKYHNGKSASVTRQVPQGTNSPPKGPAPSPPVINKVGVLDYDAGQISTSENGKVTIILRETNQGHTKSQAPPPPRSDNRNGTPKSGSGAFSKLSKGSFPEIIM